MRLKYTTPAQDVIMEDTEATADDIRDIAEFLDGKLSDFDDALSATAAERDEALSRVEELEAQVTELNGTISEM